MSSIFAVLQNPHWLHFHIWISGEKPDPHYYATQHANASAVWRLQFLA